LQSADKNIYRIVEIVDAENLASIQLLKSVGFREEGHFIENIFLKREMGKRISVCDAYSLQMH